MAKVKLNPVLEKIHGQVGDLVFKNYGDEMIVGRKPDRSGITPSEAQLEHQERFRQAVLYGRLVMADPGLRASYEKAAKAQGKPLFSLTVADFFHTPLIDEVDLSNYGGAAGDAIGGMFFPLVFTDGFDQGSSLLEIGQVTVALFKTPPDVFADADDGFRQTVFQGSEG